MIFVILTLFIDKGKIKAILFYISIQYNTTNLELEKQLKAYIKTALYLFKIVFKFNQIFSTEQ
ncbi:MAG: hypothetical protein CL605_02715 [Altibacter sp.]|nr:hypothetical protein [Altibacter sp.]